MGIITKIEDKLGDIVEKPFKGKKSFEPLIIEVTIKRRLEAKKENILGKIAIPHCISVILDESLYNDFKPFFEYFRDTLVKSLSEWIKENGYEMLQDLDMQFKKGDLDERKFDVYVSFKKAVETSPKGYSLDPHTRVPPLAKAGEGALPGEDESVKAIGGVLINSKTDERFEILQGETIIGRDEDCDVTINDPTVSRIHAFILSWNGKVILEDLGSTCGTRVNHENISKRVLAGGDRIIIGQVELRFAR